MKFGQDHARLQTLSDQELRYEKWGTAVLGGVSAVLAPLALKHGVDMYAMGETIEAYALAGVATILGTSAVHDVASVVDLRQEQLNRQHPVTLSSE